MSAYIQFFIRHEDTFLPIGIYCRSSSIYKYFDEYTPWEKIKPITRGLLDKIRGNVHEDLQASQERYDRAREMKEWVATLNNSLEEKMEYIENIEEVLGECCDEIETAKHVKDYLNFLDDIIESVEYEKHIDHKNYLYVGIEVGNPTVDDIVRQYMRVVEVPDIIHVLELHLETSETASIMLDLLDYVKEIDTSEEGCQDCKYSWWNGEFYECSRPVCKFESKEIELEEL